MKTVTAQPAEPKNQDHSHSPSSSASAPPPAYAIPALLILRDSYHRLVLVDPKTKTPLYRVHNSSWQRSVDVSRPSPQNPQQEIPVGTADFHSFSSDVDIRVQGNEARMVRKGFFSSDVVIKTPMFEWTWETVSFSSDLRLVDQTRQVVAEYESASFSLSKRGTLHFRASVDEFIRDWIVVTAMAKIEQARQRRSAAGAGGGAC